MKELKGKELAGVEDCKNLNQIRFSAISSAELSGLRVRVESLLEQFSSNILQTSNSSEINMDLESEVGGSEDLVLELSSISMFMC